MKTYIKLAAILGLGFASSALALNAAEEGAKGQGANAAALQDTGDSILQKSDQTKPSVAGLSDEIKDAVKDFQKARDEFLKVQNDLRKTLNAATSEERAKIREQLKALASDWIKEQKQLRERVREELQEVREALRNAREKQLEEVKGKGDGKHGKGRD